MSIVVHKFPVKIEDSPVIEMDPKGHIVRFDEQHDRLYVWAMVDDETEKKPRRFQLASTGYPLRARHRYIGTAKLHGGDLVFHLMEDIDSPEEEVKDSIELSSETIAVLPAPSSLAMYDPGPAV